MKTVHEALEYVAKNPVQTTDAIDTPVWELVCRLLYDIAGNPQPKVRGGLAKATRAQKMILDRKVGRRRTGSLPHEKSKSTLTFADLTKGGIES